VRIGLIARADHVGLAIQTWSFWKNAHPAYTLIPDFTRYGHHRAELETYPGAVHWNRSFGDGPDFVDVNEPDPYIDQMLDQVDVVFTCETPYNFYLYTEARRRGIRTVLQPNFEFLRYMRPDDSPEPDVFAMPSTWHLDDIRTALPGRDVRYLPVPIDREHLPFRRRTELNRILHTCGTVAQPNRNGTTTFFAAMELLQDLPLRATVYTQRNSIGADPPPNVDLMLGTLPNYWDAYGGEHDLFVMPRRWGGLCLPMQEALAAGMPVLMPDCEPNRTVLPSNMLVPSYVGGQIECTSWIDLFDVNPAELANQIRAYYQHPALVAAGSDWAREWGDAHSWEALWPQYEAAFAG
jgi:glycosyltransferase involved in cell wall biosynthesis